MRFDLLGMTFMNTQLNNQSQPLVTDFNHTRNKQKALQALSGILRGVTADTKLNDIEILFLDTWLKTESRYKKDGDFLDLIDLLEEVLEDGIIEQHELSEIQEFLSDVVDYGYQCETADQDALINQLLGFLQGITSDDVLNDKEIFNLQTLIQSNPLVLESFPGNKIHQRIETILEDDVIDDEERKDLLDMLKSISGQQFLDTGCAECGATDFFGEPIQLTSIQDKSVCFTGKFIAGSRKVMEGFAKSNSADIRSRVTKDLDYLIIGSMASRDWKFSSHGRKIESVINNQASGSTTKIINEETWMEFVE